MTEFSAIYYPFSRCFNETTLKRAILYFDRLYFLDPYNLDQREAAIETSHYYDGIDFGTRQMLAEMLEKVYRPLEGEGWIESVDIYPLIEKYEHELTRNTLADISDPDFCSYSFGDLDVNIEKVTWQVMEERFPKPLLSHLESVKWSEFKRSIAQSVAAYARFQDPYYGKYTSFEEEYYESLSEPEDRAGFPNVIIQASKCPKGSTHGMFRSAGERVGYVLPYAYGASIALNQAMLAAAEAKTALFTDSLTQQYLFRRKSLLAIETMGSEEKLTQAVQLNQRVKETDIVFSLLDSLIPHWYLSKIGIEEIVRFRRNHEAELQSLRRRMLTLRNIPAEMSYADYVLQIRETVDSLQAEVRVLERDFRRVYKDLLRDVAKVGASAALGLAITPLSISAGAVLAVLASKAPLDHIWSAWKEKAKLKESDLSYLLVAEGTFHRSLGKTERLPWERYPIAGE